MWIIENIIHVISFKLHYEQNIVDCQVEFLPIYSEWVIVV
jgi:hypothetical protein